MKSYRHTITFVTEIHEDKMSTFTRKGWEDMSEKERYSFFKEHTIGFISGLLEEANAGGSWAILKAVDNV